VVNLAEADLANDERDTLLGDVGKHARNTKTGTGHISGSRCGIRCGHFD
jgi:hypothetical protein